MVSPYFQACFLAQSLLPTSHHIRLHVEHCYIVDSACHSPLSHLVQCGCVGDTTARLGHLVFPGILRAPSASSRSSHHLCLLSRFP